MAGGYTVPDDGELGKLRRLIEQMQREIREIGRPTGGQFADQLQTLRELVDGLITQVNGIFSGYVQAGGNITSTAGAGTFPAGVNSTGVYGNLVSTGAYRVQYINVSGAMGYVPSSRQFKQDIQTAPSADEAMLAMRVVTFRYKQAVEEIGEDAALEWGVIAEEMHDLGLTWLVDYDADGKPEGVKYERLVLAVIPVVQDHERRLVAAGL